MYNIKNYTPHVVRLKMDDEIYEFQSLGVIRCDEVVEKCSPLVVGNKKVQVVKKTFTNLTGIPDDVKENDILVVSRIVAEAAVRLGCEYSRNMYTPCNIVRDENGNISYVDNLMPAL